LNGSQLVGHLEEQQVSELLDVIAIRHAVVAEDVAVVPELLDDSVDDSVAIKSTRFSE
jgi:hypothetical protein